MKDVMHNYDVFPKVFPKDKEIEITVKPLGAHVAFEREQYDIVICPLSQGTPRDYPNMTGFEKLTVKPDADGCIRFKYAFKGEQEHYIRFLKENGDRDFQLSVYSLDEDLCGRYPFVGDLHMHTCRSDGKQAPAIVAANYRRHGYDFLSITDHRLYYGSLEAINAYKDVPLEFTLIPGEEVHMTRADAHKGVNDVHMVNFGGLYSVNALAYDDELIEEIGEDKALRAVDGNCPEMMSREAFEAEVNALADTMEIPEGVERFPFACCRWIKQQINKADGLCIFAHPYWISNVFQVPEKFSQAMFDYGNFDAFEVLGGESYFEQNGLQTVFYYEQCAKGNKYPIVGSTDSHSSFNNRNAFICSTIVFAPENTRESLISSIKDFYTVAVDTISAEYRMVGDLRLVKYASFLYENFFPLHDELCREEGMLMKLYATGDEDAARLLNAIHGRMKKQREKYFEF